MFVGVYVSMIKQKKTLIPDWNDLKLDTVVVLESY